MLQWNRLILSSDGVLPYVCLQIDTVEFQIETELIIMPFNASLTL